MVLKFVEEECYSNNNETDNEKSGDRSGVVTEVRIIFYVITHSVAGSDHLS